MIPIPYIDSGVAAFFLLFAFLFCYTQLVKRPTIIWIICFMVSGVLCINAMFDTVYKYKVAHPDPVVNCVPLGVPL